jgi:hypothetical protein
MPPKTYTLARRRRVLRSFIATPDSDPRIPALSIPRGISFFCLLSSFLLCLHICTYTVYTAPTRFHLRHLTLTYRAPSHSSNAGVHPVPSALSGADSKEWESMLWHRTCTALRCAAHSPTGRSRVVHAAAGAEAETEAETEAAQ